MSEPAGVVAPAVVVTAPRPGGAAEVDGAAGRRSRAGNAMGRTRAALLAAAVQAVERQGVRRTTMSDVATIAGVAKATLYNHFRTKDDVLAGVVASGLDALADECERVARSAGLAAALERAAGLVGTHPALRRVVSEEPALVRPLLAPAAGDGRADAAVARILVAAGVHPDPTVVELVRRWVGSYVWDGAAGDAAAGAALLAAALDAGSPTAAAPAAGAG